MTLLFLGGGLWIILVLLAGAAGLFWYLAIKASKSGSKYQDKSGNTVYSDQNIPVWKTGYGKFAIALTIALIVVYFLMRSDR